MSYNTVLPTTKLQDSLTPLQDRDDENRSHSAGTSFPTTNLMLGMQCYRTDTGVVYVLQQITPSVTWTPLYFTANNDGRYAQLGSENTFNANMYMNATTTERTIVFSTSTIAGRFSYFFARPSDEAVGLYNQRNATAVWQYSPGSNILNLQSGTTIAGYTAWHQGNDGIGSGLDAGLLGGAPPSYFLDYNNFTNRPTLADAAYASIASIQAGVTLSTRVAKTGDTMTGRLILDNNAHLQVMSNGLIYFNNPGVAAVGMRLSTTTSRWSISSVDGNGNVYSDWMALDPGGGLWTSAYGWLHDYFAQRPTIAGMGATNATGNCGDIPTHYGVEVYDSGAGNHQTRQYKQNCSNCNCNCATNCTPGYDGPG